MGNKRKHSDCVEDKRKTVFRAHIRFEFNSQTFMKVVAAFGAFKTESKVLSNGDVTVTKRENQDRSINFSMTDVKKTTTANVTVHIHPSTKSLIVQGKTGSIMNNHPFISFTDIFLEPLLDRLVEAGGQEQDKSTIKEDDATTIARPPPLKKARVTKPGDERNIVQPPEGSVLTKCQGVQMLISAFMMQMVKKKKEEPKKEEKIVKKTEVEAEKEKKIAKKTEVEAEKEKNIEPEKDMPTVSSMHDMPFVPSMLEEMPTFDDSFTLSGVENKNFRDPIEYNTNLKNKVEIAEPLITNLNVNQKEQRLKLAIEKKKNARLGNELKLLEGRKRALEDRIGSLEKSNTKYQQDHQTLSGRVYNEKHLTCKLQDENSGLQKRIGLLEKNNSKLCCSIELLQSTNKNEKHLKLQQENQELKIKIGLLEIDIQNSFDNKNHVITLKKENSELKKGIELLERKDKKLEPNKVLLDITSESNMLNQSTQSNHDQTFSPYNTNTRARRRNSQKERRVSNFKRQHIEGKHEAGKQKNIKAENLGGQKVVLLGPIMGRGEGEQVYVTVADVKYTGTGLADESGGQAGRLVITALSLDEEGVAPVHLNGPATKMDDGRVIFKGEYYSPCISQELTINVSV